MAFWARTALVLGLIAGLGGDAAAADFGTADEARAMLEITVDAIQDDRDATLAAINTGADPRFKDRDLYPFCGDAAGMFVAHGANATLVGQSLKDLKDKAGTPLGEALYANAAPDSVAEVSYMWPRPGETEPIDKVSLVTAVGDDVCAVGYYK